MKTDKLVNTSVLSALVPISSMDAGQIAQLATRTYFEAVPPGESLFESDDDDRWAIYVLSGEVELISRDGAITVVVGGTPEATVPLSHHKPRVATAKTKTKAIFIRIEEAVYRGAAAQQQTHEAPVAPLHEADDGAEKKILQDIERAFKAEKLVVPSLPDVALKVRDAVQDPKNDADAISKLVQADPALAARIVQVANSPMYRGQSAITSCRAAVSRLGLSVTRSSVMSYSVQQLFNTEKPLLKERMTQLWRHSTQIAAISAVMGGLIPKVDADRAMLAGLIHEIGTLPIIAYTADHPQLASDPKLLDGIIGSLSSKVGTMVLQRWRFDNELVAVTSESHDWLRDPGPEADYVDVVLLAHLYSYFDSPNSEAYPAMEDVPAFNKLPLGRMGPAVTVKVLDTARSNIEELQQMLQG